MVHSRSSVQHTRGTASTPQQPPTPTPQQQPSHAAPAPARDIETPPLCEQVLGVICKGLEEGTYSIGTTWPVFSEAWWWEALLARKPFRCIYEDQPGEVRQPLIQTLRVNLSQTPREQCELDSIVTEGREVEGPGQEVEVHGLKARPELNGRRGRVLPSSGRGSAPEQPSPGRVAVRLAPKDPSHSTSKLEVISVKPANLRSPHRGAAGGSGGSSQQQQQSARSSTAAAEAAAAAFSKHQRIKQLLKQEFELWGCGSTITPDTLRRARMPERLICCGQCGKAGIKPAAAGGARRQQQQQQQPSPAGQGSSGGGSGDSGGNKPSSKGQLRQQQRQQQQQQQEEEDNDSDRIAEFIALKRTHAPSPIPLPASAVELRCLECFAAMAAAVGMKLSAQGAEDFCDTFMMGPIQVCSILQGLPTVSWSGVSLGKGEMY